MDTLKKNRTEDTVRIRRPPKVFTDILGRTVWMSGIEPCELELDGDNGSSSDPYNTYGATLAT